MDAIQEFVDERQKSWCIHCGGWISALECNRDHVPSKSLLRKPYPANLPTVRICTQCNAGFSKDEEYLAAFLGSVLSVTTDPGSQDSCAAERILRENARLRTRIERSKKEYQTIAGETRCIWTPEAVRIRRVIVKNARGHAFFECGEPMLREPDRVWWSPLEHLSWQRQEFEHFELGPAWPEVGSRMMMRMITGQDLDGSWVTVQDGIYRYGVGQVGAMLVRTVLWEYLATEVFWGEPD
jgi:hypothetical protein